MGRGPNDGRANALGDKLFLVEREQGVFEKFCGLWVVVFERQSDGIQALFASIERGKPSHEVENDALVPAKARPFQG